MAIVWIPEIPGLAEPLSATDDVFPFDSWASVRSPLAERVHVCGPCSSVLDVAMHLAREGRLDVWDSVLATRQWAGRGQMRRTWISEPGNLFAAWRLPLPPEPWQNMVSVLIGWLHCAGLGDLGARLHLK